MIIIRSAAGDPDVHRGLNSFQQGVKIHEHGHPATREPAQPSQHQQRAVGALFHLQQRQKGLRPRTDTVLHLFHHAAQAGH